MLPPDEVVPPNCVFELDDVTKPWTWKQKFDLINLRYVFFSTDPDDALTRLRWMLGSFTAPQWTELYVQTYSRLQPGGWFENIEPSVIYRSDDGSLPVDYLLADWGQKVERMGAKPGSPFNTFDTMKRDIEAAGFTNWQEKI